MDSMEIPRIAHPQSYTVWVSLLKFAQCYRALSQNTFQTIIASALHFRPNHDDTIIDWSIFFVPLVHITIMVERLPQDIGIVKFL